MSTLGGLSTKSVMVKFRDQKPMVATVKNVEQSGIWLSGPALSNLGADIQNGSFFFPWASVDWIAAKD